MPYIIKYKGYGRYKHSPKPKKISDSQAKRFEEEGISVYNSKEDAEKNCN